MTKLFKFEFRRLFRQKSFIVLTAVSAVLVFLSLGTVKLLELATNSLNEMQDPESMFRAGYTGFFALRDATSSGSVDTVIAVIAAIFVCSEYSFGTLKTVTAMGFSRCKIFAAEFVAALTAALTVFAAASLSAFLFGTLFWEAGTLSSTSVKAIFLQLLIVFALTAVIFTLSKCIKKTGGAIALGIFAPTVVHLLLSVADAAIDSEKIKLTDYWLSGCLSSVQATSPLNVDFFAIISGTPNYLTSELAVRVIIVSAVYIALSFVLGTLAFRKQEI